MKKIPTCFIRVFEKHKIKEITPEFSSEICRDAVYNGTSTIKFDGSCCTILSGDLYKRYDYKPGRQLPEGAIPCQEKPDETTGHFPHWVKCDKDKPEDKWLLDAYDRYKPLHLWRSGDTFEAIGKHFNGNAYHLENDILVPHGTIALDVPRNFEGLRKFLAENYIEGIVFWKDGAPVCKIKRIDFGFDWNGKGK